MEIKGVDISAYKKGISIQKLKDNGVKFVILRAGLTFYGGDGTNKAKDDCFESFYNECKRVGMPVGCYWYSCADNRQKGIDEATFMYNNCLKGKKFEYPVVMDVENQQWQYNKKRGVTDACKGFCETLENLGYYVSIYGSDIGTFKDKVYMNELQDYDKWVARWGSKPTYAIPYGMWQWTDSEKIAGYSVDGDYAYKDYPAIMIEKKVNGYGDEPENFLPERGYFKVGDSGENVEKIDTWLSTWIPEQVKGNYYGNFTEKNIMALQQKAKDDGIYDDAIDGCIGQKTLSAMEHYGFKE